MSEKIAAALTAAEWDIWSCTKENVAMAAHPSQPYLSAGDAFVHGDGFDAGPEARHALAALALYGQPFGFTHEDVDALRRIATPWTGALTSTGETLVSIADRISALLPEKK